MAKVSSIVKTPLIPDHQGFDGETIPSQRGIWRGGDVIEEAKLQLWLAGPLIAVSLLQYSLQVTSVMFVGHLGELALSSASMASSFASVTGFSVLLRVLVFRNGCSLVWSFPEPKTGNIRIIDKMVYMISVGLGSAIRSVIHVSNELGAGRPQGTQLALRVMTAMALLEGAGITTATVLVHFVWGKLYSNENEVIVYVARMMPLLAVSDFLDGFQCVLSGPNQSLYITASNCLMKLLN
ncbi:protein DETOXIFICATION 16-like [Pyrus communis]|uniref:protein DETOXIFICATION 16-like n=1 Tax=Pyrus communis TaxID=23211 RepID=UPI0035C02BD7